MKRLANNQMIDLMRSRKSVRHFEPDRKIPQDVLQAILSAAATAPSAWNLQHWRFLVIESEEWKERVLPAAWNQQQVRDCSALIVVLGDKEAYRNGEKIFGKQVELGYMPEELKQTYLNILPNTYQTGEFAEHDAIRNASLAAMQILLAAHSLGIDSCPMVGFKKEELRRELSIPGRYVPVVLITLGYGIKPAHETIRLPLEDLVIQESF